MAYQKMCMNELFCQPTFPLGKPMDPIRPILGGDFSLAQLSEGGGVVQDFQFCNPLDDFRKGGMNTFQNESCSDLLLNTENMARMEDQAQMLLDSTKNVVHAHGHANTGIESSNDQYFPCVNADNRFNGGARQMTDKKNGKAHKRSRGGNRGQWTVEEDRKLIELMQARRNGGKLWATVSHSMDGSRLGKQCRERWNNHLKPGIAKKKEWTEDEDRAIVDGHKKYNNRWADIAKIIPGRTEISVKNRWNSTWRKLSAVGTKQRQSKHPPPSPILQEYIKSIKQMNSTGTANDVQEAPMNTGYYMPVIDNNQGIEAVVDPSLPFNLDMSMFDEEMFEILNEGITSDNVMPSDAADHLSACPMNNKEMDLFEMIAQLR